jgi:hypothetical protein
MCNPHQGCSSLKAESSCLKICHQLHAFVRQPQSLILIEEPMAGGLPRGMTDSSATEATPIKADDRKHEKQMASLAAAIYISPKQLACRWSVSRSTADRIARDNHFTRFLPGEGTNATVRYLVKEVIRYEQSRLIASAA